MVQLSFQPLSVNVLRRLRIADGTRRCPCGFNPTSHGPRGPSSFATLRTYWLNLYQSVSVGFSELSVFLCSTSNQQQVIEAGEKLLLLLTGAKMEKSLDELRLFKFSQKIVTSKVAVQPEALGPASDAANFHLLRVFYQVQVWMGAKGYRSICVGLDMKR